MVFDEVWRRMHPELEFLTRIKDKHDEEKAIDVSYEEVKDKDGES